MPAKTFIYVEILKALESNRIFQCVGRYKSVVVISDVVYQQTIPINNS